MFEGTDLFGGPVLRRSASFLRPDVRIRLTRDWADGPRACVIGCNPSDAGADRDDNTSRWWNRWFAHYGYGGYDAVNMYPFVTSNPKECRRIYERAINGGEWYDRDALMHNLDEVARLAKTADRVFVCFGNISWDSDWTEHVIEHVQTGAEPWPALWCWGKTKTGAPIHPMARGKHRINPLAEPILWRDAA